MRRNLGKLLFIAWLLLIANVSYAELKMYFINVGQGDSEYLLLPAGKSALIDGGPDKAGISEFVQTQHITHINYVVLTHPHADHFAGLNYVFDHCQVDAFYDTRMDNSKATGDDRLRAKAAGKCTVIYPAEGDTLDWDPQVTVQVLHAHPDAAAASDGTALNESSIVLRITYNNQSVLFTGDIDTTIEDYLDTKYGDQLSATVLKVAHHGSRYASSTEFLDHVKPKFAYIEVGEGNRYKHPHAEALDRLQQVGAKVMRTDQNGTMEYTIQ
jgi:competence protein ComEC